MTQYNGLLSSIAQSLSIARGTAEDDISWKCRIVYSVLGNLALASLWDIQDEHEPISVTHFKHRIEQLTKAYFLMYPEVKAHFLPEIEKLYDEIYESYLNTGYIYHSPKRIAPAALTQAKHGNIIFQRGVPLNQRVFMSGLGLYQVSKEQTKSNHSVQSMFLLKHFFYPDILKIHHQYNLLLWQYRYQIHPLFQKRDRIDLLIRKKEHMYLNTTGNTQSLYNPAIFFSYGLNRFHIVP